MYDIDISTSHPTSPSHKSAIHIISNDKGYTSDLSSYLSGFDYIVRVYTDIPQLFGGSGTPYPDIVIVDLPLVSNDAARIVRHYYAMDVSPCLLFLSSYSHDIDIIVMLELGADDVFSKSVSFRELLARTRAAERRYKALTHARALYINNGSPSKLGAVSYSNWVLELDSLTLVSPRGNRVMVSRSELQILLLLFRNPGTRFSRADLSLSIGRTDDDSSRHIDSIVVRLRRKLAKEGSDTLIETAPGIGYFCKG